jgi:hypothetical protein
MLSVVCFPYTPFPLIEVTNGKVKNLLPTKQLKRSVFQRLVSTCSAAPLLAILESLHKLTHALSLYSGTISGNPDYLLHYLSFGSLRSATGPSPMPRRPTPSPGGQAQA